MHCPDITLKGKNQDVFQHQLVENIRRRLHGLGMDWPVYSARGRVYIDSGGRDRETIRTVLNAMADTAGITSMAAAVWLQPARLWSSGNELNWPLIEDAMVEMAAETYQSGRSFSVRVNRVDKSLPGRSQDMEARLGRVIRERTDWDDVNLKNPDRTFYIDAYPDGLYLYSDKRPGIGGLPVGTGGRLLALLSGGIDSPVAAFMMAKRGCSIDLFHMTASHLAGSRMEESVVFRLAREISRFSLRTRLYTAPYTYFDLALQDRKSGYELVLFRRFLMSMAEQLARRIGAGALVTGDSLGQVASQTMENLTAASQHIQIPVMRPLIGMNKQEIIAQARSIGTYDISIQPYKDCCALIGQNPRTRSRHEQLQHLEEHVFDDYDRMVEDTFRDMMCYEFRCGEFTGVTESDKADSAHES
ncbi:MAG: tRNA uracil 4-sulfurtransferase ThiI [Gammaproteobacteria bacterium]